MKDIFSLFTLKNMRKYYCYVHDASFMHMGLSAYVKYPRNIVIEPTTVCNLKCTLCPRGANVLNRSIEQMDVEKYKKFIHEAPLYVDSIYFTLYGEPLLHGNIIEMLRFAKQSGIRHIELSTNANIKRENAFFSELVLSGLDCINIAVDSMNQEVYSDYRKGGDISTVLTFIDTLVLIKKKHNITRPLLRIQILDLKHNEHERKIMQYKLLKRGVDNVFVKPLVDFTLRSENEYTHFKKSTDTNTQQRDNTFVCKALFTTMVISASGDLMLCCLDYKVNHAIGNVFTEGFKAYSNKKFIAYRQLFLKNKLQIPLCNECITFNRKIRSIT